MIAVALVVFVYYTAWVFVTVRLLHLTAILAKSGSMILNGALKLFYTHLRSHSCPKIMICSGISHRDSSLPPSRLSPLSSC